MEFGEDSAGTVPFFVRVNSVMSVPVPHRGGHSMSDAATTYPVDDGSVWIAGTGVKACEPSEFDRPVNLPDVNVLAAGQVVIGVWPCGLEIHSRSDEVDS